MCPTKSTSVKPRRKPGTVVRLKKPKKATKKVTKEITSPVLKALVENPNPPAKVPNPFKATYFKLPPPRVIVGVKDKKRLGRVSRLEDMSKEQYSQYLEAVRQGCFANTAIGTFGIPPRSFYRWMELGRKNWEGWELAENDLDFYGQFFLDTTEAQSAARSFAESKEMRGNTTNYLMNGPGRQTKEQEGYASGAQKLELTGRDGGPVEIEATITREDKRLAVAAALLELMKANQLGNLMQPALVGIASTPNPEQNGHRNGNGTHS